jgi:predicted outer membrane protein
MRKFTGWIVAGTLAMAATIAIAQVPREPAAPRREPAPGRDPAPGLRDPAQPPAAREALRGGAPAQTSRGDQEIAAIKLAFCRNELELAKLASQKAESDEVKQFAAKMVKEHTEGCGNLEKWAGNLAAAGGRADRPAPADRREADERPAAGAPGGRAFGDAVVRGGQGGPLNWVVIHQQLADQCLASAKAELAKKEGAEFDKCFIGMAIGGHQHAVDADRVFASHVSQQFRGEIDDCLKMASAHLAEAKDIYGKLTGESPRLTRTPNALPELPRRPE